MRALIFIASLLLHGALATSLQASPARPVPSSSPACPPAADTAIDAAPLPHLSAALKPGTMLSVLAVGSATVFGPQTSVAADAAPARGAPPPTASQTGFPWQMAHALEAAVHGLHVNVTVIGGRGLSAEDMLARLRAELARHAYALVIWQTGTMEAVNQVPPEDFYQTLTDGAAAVAAAGADLVLVDPQYSRFLEANANLAPYSGAMQAAGAMPGVVLFHRYGLMRDWTDDGVLDLERAAKADRPNMAVRLHACLGRELARSLLADLAAAE